MKRKVAASVAVGMSVMMGVTPAFAANGTSNSEVYKEEFYKCTEERKSFHRFRTESQGVIRH